MISAGAAFALMIFALSVLLENHRPAIQQRISQAFGDAAAFDGLSVSWSGFGLSARNLRIADDPRFAATPFIHSARLKIRLRWLPLIRGRIEIEKFILQRPEIQIIRNEAADLNILDRDRPQGRPAAGFFRPALDVVNGRIEYIDRSARTPVEIQIENLDLELSAPNRDGRMRVKLAATVFHPQGHGQNVTLQGWAGGASEPSHWMQAPLDLRVRAEAFLLGQLMRAVPALREQASEILDVTGPISLSARLQGSLRQPRVSDLTLIGPFFGSSRPNLKLTGSLDLTQSAVPADGYFKGDLTLDPVAYERLKRLPFVQDILPSSLDADGPLRIVTAVEGTLAQLKIKANVQGRHSEISYREWVKKPKGTPGSMQLTVVFLKDKTIFEDSIVNLHNLRLRFSGFLDALQGQLVLRLYTEGVELSGWEKVIPALADARMRGRSRFRLAVVKPLAGWESTPRIWGELHLTDVEIKELASKKEPLFDKISGQVAFHGSEARLVDFLLGIGSSSISLQGVLQNYAAPVLRYDLRSDSLRLSDLEGLPGKETDSMTKVYSRGEVTRRGDGFAVRGRLASPAGVLQGFAYRDLAADLEWFGGALDLRKFSLRTMGGRLAGSGVLRSESNKASFALRPSATNLDLNELLPRNGSAFVPQIEGRLNVEAAISGQGTGWSEAWRSMEGGGRVEIHRGVIKNFNFADHVLSNVSGLPGIAKLISGLPSGAKDSVIKRRDTPFQAFTSSFSVSQGRITARDLALDAPEFEVNGDGTVGLDRTLKLAATLVMSPEFSRELAKEHPNIRFLLDRGGRLVVPFRVEGTTKRPQLRPDLRRLAESIQRGLLGRPASDAADQRQKKR